MIQGMKGSYYVGCRALSLALDRRSEAGVTAWVLTLGVGPFVVGFIMGRVMLGE
jgi:hypothetical protein